MPYYFCILFGVIPSFIWLAFYLRKDRHPESNSMVLKVFFYGMLSAIPAVFLELGFIEILKKFNLSLVWAFIITVFIGVALMEELVKFLVVRFKVFYHQEMDEPMDVMLYMIIAALGFAASENILVFVSLLPDFVLKTALQVSIFRFLGATFLHTLSSGIIGYFLAISFCETKKRIPIFIAGFALAVILHGFYNLPMMETKDALGNYLVQLPEYLKIGIPAMILLIMGIFVTWGFNKLKKMKGVCKLS